MKDGWGPATQASGSKLPRHKIKGENQAILVFNARRNATNNLTISCGSSRCGTFTSAIFFFLVMVRGCRKDPPCGARKIVVFVLSGKSEDSFLCDINMP
ncbi:hypothetical protein M1D68_24290 [Pseudomonas sp. R4-84]